MVVTESLPTGNLQSDPRDHAISQGVISQARVLGGAIGVAASNAVFHYQLQARLAGIVPQTQLSQVQLNSETVESLTLAQQDDVRVTFASSFDESMQICTGIAALGLLASLATYQRHPPDINEKRKQMEDLIIACAKKQMSRAEGGGREQI